MNRAVFDTNVLVSGFLSPHGPPGRIVEGLRAGIFQAVLDDRIFHEYAEVLARPRFGLPPKEVEIVLAAIRARSFHPDVFKAVHGLPTRKTRLFWSARKPLKFQLSLATSGIFRNPFVGK